MDQRTVKIRIDITNDQLRVLKETAQECIKIFNYFRTVCIEHKSTSYQTLHKFGYENSKLLCPTLPVGLVQTSAKQACASVRSWNSNNPKKKWEYDGEKTSLQIPYDLCTISRRGNLTTLSTTNKRIRILHEVPEWFIKRYNLKQDNIQAATIKIYSNDTVYLNLMYRIEISEPWTKGKVIGIDRGLYNLAALSDGTIYSSKRHIAVKRKRQYQRKQLQQKGTRSAKRRQKLMNGREMRFMLDVNHCITKQLANRKDVSFYVLEDLMHIRDERKGKKLNSWLSNWAYFQFQTLLEYKCIEKGKEVKYTNPAYTSQKCFSCKTIDKTSRNKSRYVCPVCGYTNHSDINAALNIRDNYLCRL